MSKTQFVPFEEFPSTLSRYSSNNQLQANQYKKIIESEKVQGIFDRQYESLDQASKHALNPNVPLYNKRNGNIKVGDKTVNVYKQFYEYKQPASAIFTNWQSASLNNIEEDMSVSHMPYEGIYDRNLVLSNTNNVRSNFQNYGKEYLTNVNMLNTIAWDNGIARQSNSTSSIRTSRNIENFEIAHGNFANAATGDLVSKQYQQLHVDLPPLYANVDYTSWQYINPSFVLLNNDPRLELFPDKLRFGTFDLESMKLVGKSCLTADFNISQPGSSTPGDVYNDEYNYPPVDSSLYCSANTNYVTMPNNYLHKKLDTSFQVSPGNNSLTIGVNMSSQLKDFINNQLYLYNRDLVFMQICKVLDKYARMNRGEPIENIHPYGVYYNRIQKIAPYLFNNGTKNRGTMMNYNEFSTLNDDQVYKYIYRVQKQLSGMNLLSPDVEIFINHLNIYKIGGQHNSEIKAKVKIDMGNKIASEIEIEDNGFFILVPTMLSEDVFAVRDREPQNSNYKFNDLVPQNKCSNTTDCAFRGKSGEWLKHRQHDKPVDYVDNYNFMDVARNKSVGVNPYNAPSMF